MPRRIRPPEAFSFSNFDAGEAALRLLRPGDFAPWRRCEKLVMRQHHRAFRA
jgi:hypothetical protein